MWKRMCVCLCVCVSCAWSEAGSQTPAVMLTFRSAWLMRDQQGMPPSKSGNGSPVRKPSDPIPPPASHTRTPTQKLSNPISKSCHGLKPAFWPLTLSRTFLDTICSKSAMKMFYIWLVWLEINSTVFKYLSDFFVVWKVDNHCVCSTSSKSSRNSLLWNQILEAFKEMFCSILNVA